MSFLCSCFGDVAVSKVSVVLLQDGRIVLVKRRAKSGNHAITWWECPGGKPDSPDEDPQAVAQRECREETGVRIEKLRYLGLAEHPHHKGRLVAYYASVSGFGTPYNAAPNEHVAVDVFSPKDLSRVREHEIVRVPGCILNFFMKGKKIRPWKSDPSMQHTLQ